MNARAPGQDAIEASEYAAWCAEWVCPFCGKEFGTHPDPDPAAISCCGEVGHLTRREDDESLD